MTKKALYLLLILAFSFGAVVVSAQDGNEGKTPLDPMDDTFHWGDLEMWQGMEGTTVEVFGAIEGVEAEWLQAEVFGPFSEATGITVEYEGSGDFETLVLIRAEGGDPPDIALFPQPGLIQDQVDRGYLLPLWPELVEYVESVNSSAWIDLQTFNDELYGLNFNANVKSIVWYPVPEFEEAGYAVPETWDELMALSDQIVADGSTPWCIAVESSGATGWPATDWVEDIMLRTVDATVYDQWVNHEIPFNDDRVKAAIELFGSVALNPDYVYGGPTAILSTRFQDGANPLFDDPPSCWMHRQASFIAGLWSGGVAGEDASFFYFPPIDESIGKPVLGGASVGVMYADNDRPEVRAVMEFLAHALSQELFAPQGSFLSPHQEVAMEAYPDELSRLQAAILRDADIFRFDGSDLMPGAIGAGAFWTAMVDYIGGESVDDITTFVENAWQDLE
jgi:alpha-glucoside transport system substrate-binding protein